MRPQELNLTQQTQTAGSHDMQVLRASLSLFFQRAFVVWIDAPMRKLSCLSQSLAGSPCTWWISKFAGSSLPILQVLVQLPMEQLLTVFPLHKRLKTFARIMADSSSLRRTFNKRSVLFGAAPYLQEGTRSIFPWQAPILPLHKEPSDLHFVRLADSHAHT